MVKIVQATCSNGELILSEKLSPEVEGKTLQIIILDPSETSDTDGIDSRGANIKQFLERVKNYSFKLPPDYKFNREELFERYNSSGYQSLGLYLI